MNILITGGAGYIGSVVTEECLAVGHNTFVVDNLVSGYRRMVHPDAGFYETDIKDSAAVRKILRQNRIGVVIHLAAFPAGRNSKAGRYGHYGNDVGRGLSLLGSMRESGVRKIIFSSTIEVYGGQENQPIEETAELRPTGTDVRTKLALEKALKWFEHTHGIKYAILRIANAAGAGRRCLDLDRPGTNLIQHAVDVARMRIPMIRIRGNDYPTSDGTLIRDYVHVRDLARAHVLALNGLEKRSEIYNLGSGKGYSVREVIHAAQEVTGKLIPYVFTHRRSGDPPVLVASSEKISRELGWSAELSDLRSIIKSAWIRANDHQIPAIPAPDGRSSVSRMTRPDHY